MNTIINQKFGKLTVLKQEGFYKNGNKLYLCLCDCGGLCKTSLPHLKRGEVKSCGCLAKESQSKNGKLGKKDLLNQRFGKLVVIKENMHTKYGIKWTCQCDCGKQVIVLGTNLRKKYGTISCGCFAIEQTIKRNKNKRANNPWLVEMYHYESGAKQRNLSFNLDEEIFKKLILDKCYYCNSDPNTKCQSAELKEQNILRNGIDRLDPNLGYNIENCVSCCWNCNNDKSNKTYENFINDIKIRYLFLKSKNII